MKEWVSPIPKKVHLIWIGGEPPDYLNLFLESFKKNMSDFDIKVWGNKELNKKRSDNMGIYKKSKKIPKKPMKKIKILVVHFI